MKYLMCQKGSTVQLFQIKSLDKKIQGRVQSRSGHKPKLFGKLAKDAQSFKAWGFNFSLAFIT